MGVRATEPHAKRGKKVLAGSKEGHSATHGTAAEKRERWEAYREAVDKCIADGLGKTASYKRVARKYGLDPGSVARI